MVLLSFVAIADVVVKGEVFLWSHGGSQMFLLYLEKHFHDDNPPWTPPCTVVGRTCKDTLTLKLAM